MTLLQPIALNNATSTERPTATVFRRMLSGLSSGGDADSDSAGVLGAGALKVTEHAGTPNNTVDIAAGGAFCEATEGTSAGIYYVYNDATVSVTVTTGNATNPRKDLVICEVEDSAEAGTPDDAHFVVVAGTAAASPVDPDLQALGYDNYVVLARIDVPALDTTITNSQITDMRTASAAWASPRGYVTRATITSNISGVIGSPSDISGLSTTFTASAGRRYKLSGYVRADQTSTASGGFVVTVSITDSSNTVVQEATKNLHNPAGAATPAVVGMFEPWTIVTPSAGSVTYKMRFNSSTSVLNFVADSTRPGQLLVEDAGGYLS